jgi:hypothetical protein
VPSQNNHKTATLTTELQEQGKKEKVPSPNNHKTATLTTELQEQGGSVLQVRFELTTCGLSDRRPYTLAHCANCSSIEWDS